MNILCKTFILLFLFYSTLFANTQPKQKVLILHSYHQNFKWTKDIDSGINSIIKYIPNVEIYTEYMDTKRFVDKSYYKKLFTLYKTKYEDTKFDLILSSDNNAFDFLKKYNHKLFKSAPVVFCGVNYLKKEEVSGYPNFTGVNEQANIKRNIDLIMRLHKEAKNILIITDTTTTGKRVKQEALETLKLYKNTDIKFEIIDNITVKDLKDKVSNLSSDSVILLTVFFRSANNKFYEYFEISELINKYSSSPLYGLWDFNIEHGIIGGFLTSGFFQGQKAAQMGEKILNGYNVENIPLELRSPNQYIFDYKQIEKYGVEEELLPSISYIRNKPNTFFELYKKEIITLFVVFSIMFILIIILFTNIQQKKKAQKEIKKQLKFQQDLIDNVNAPIYYKNKEGQYIGCNKAFELLFDMKKDEILNKSVYDIALPKFAQSYDKKDKELLKTGISQKFEGQHQFKNNETREFIFYKNAFYNDEDEIDGLIGAIFDITELKNTSHKLNELNKNLEKEVSKRTNELKVANEDLEDSNEELQTTIYNLEQTQKQLVTSEKMASLGGLVAGVAHEINTPVGVCVTAVSHLLEINEQIIKEYNNDNMTEENFQEFLKVSNELSSSINLNLIKTAKLVKSFKQISVDQTSEEKREFYIDEYVHEILISMANTLKQTNLNIKVNCDKKFSLYSYPGSLSQIFTNLILNSIKHGFNNDEKGDIDIDISKKDNKINIIYKDNGRGIDKKNINKIFDPFFTTNRKEGGTGLGLNIVYNIVTTNLHGTIECKSDAGIGGVIFSITFPDHHS